MGIVNKIKMIYGNDATVLIEGAVYVKSNYTLYYLDKEIKMARIIEVRERTIKYGQLGNLGIVTVIILNPITGEQYIFHNKSYYFNGYWIGNNRFRITIIDSNCREIINIQEMKLMGILNIVKCKGKKWDISIEYMLFSSNNKKALINFNNNTYKIKREILGGIWV